MNISYVIPDQVSSPDLDPLLDFSPNFDALEAQTTLMGSSENNDLKRSLLPYNSVGIDNLFYVLRFVRCMVLIRFF